MKEHGKGISISDFIHIITAILQRQVILHLFLSELPKRWLRPPRLSTNLALFQFRNRRDGHDTDLNRLFCHLTLETFFEREEGSMYGIFKTDIVVISGCAYLNNTRLVD
jgi:hypothetical protein